MTTLPPRALDKITLHKSGIARVVESLVLLHVIWVSDKNIIAALTIKLWEQRVHGVGNAPTQP